MEQQLSELIAEFRRNQHLELEVRMSRLENNAETHISEHLFQDILSCFQNATLRSVLTNPLGTRSVVDFFFKPSDDEKALYESTRLRTEIGSPGMAVMKSKLSSLKAICAQRPSILFHFTLKKEVPFVDKNSLKTKAPHFIRLQEVTEFFYRDIFKYSFKKVYEGVTKQDACSRPAHYEIEIEIGKIQKQQMSNLELANSFIVKVLDLVGKHPKYPTLHLLLQKSDPTSLKKNNKRKTIQPRL